LEELLSAHRLWSDWLREGRVRKIAFVAEKADVPLTGVARTGVPRTDVPRTDVPRTDVPRTEVPRTHVTA
jgi:hypothetical protein